MSPMIALNGDFSRKNLKVICDESDLMPALIQSNATTSILGNDAIVSAETARAITQKRVRFLWGITESPNEDFSAPALSRYTLWLLNASSQQCKQWRDDIAQALCSELYPTLALDYFFRNAISRGVTEEGRFKWTRNLLGSLIHFSDCSRDFRKSMLENGAVEDLILFLSESTAVKNEAALSKNFEKVLCYVLAILLNMAKMSSAKQAFNGCSSFEILRKYLDYEKNSYVKGAAALCLASVARDDDKTVKILEEDGIPSFLRHLYDEAAKSQDRLCSSITCQEVGDALKILAASDSLKTSLLKLGILDVAVDLIKIKRTNVEQYRGVDIVWTLCFGPNSSANCKIIAQNDKCLSRLKRLVEDSKTADDVRELARRTLAFIEEWEKTSNKDAKRPVTTGEIHILLSYSCNYQHLVERIRDLLEGNNFKVWMGCEKSGDHVPEEIAAAIENASIVIVALSESYRRSPHCRTEAEYAWALNKQVLPVLVEKNYIPDGWLGELVSSKLQVDGTQEIESLWIDKAGCELLVQVGKLLDGSKTEDTKNKEAQSGRCLLQ